MNENKIEEIIKTYESIVKVVDKKAREDKNRSYGGIIRSIKGWLQEYMTEEIIKLAWDNIKGDAKRLEINSKKHKIPIQRIYVENIKDIEIKNYILNNIKKYYYSLSVDKQVFVDNKFVLGIECKAYTENAMLKRILVDFSLLKTSYPEINCYLFQLESQLGGDYSKLNKKTYGSYPTHTLMSYFPEVNLNIFTFLEGERKVDKPIHKYFKSLNKNKIKEAVELLSFDLKRYL
ncbi:MAG TPA: restriction endonuclease [Spirochaetota bacterium]|nr:restriction endonuclease [Spirochaetota bacterium]HPP04250.1 restriction endonuclease [Spirochaetota bacterium]